MTTTRVDLFTPLHKGLRKSMYDTGALLERTNFADATEKSVAIASLGQTLDFFEEHLRLEGAHVAPLLRESSAELLGELKGQHDEHEDATKRMRDLKQELSKCGGAAAVDLGQKLCMSYNEMVADQSIHMNREERMANPALWSAHSDDVLAVARDNIQAAHTPERLREWLKLIIQGANQQETITMLKLARAQQPEIFSLALTLTKQEEESWPKIEKALKS